MRKKSKGRFTKVILVIMFIYLVLFTFACLFITYKTGNEPNTLIMCVFTFCGVEGGLSAWIKTTKVRKKEPNETKEI